MSDRGNATLIEKMSMMVTISALGRCGLVKRPGREWGRNVRKVQSKTLV